jgi:hypothetical protein
VVLACLYIKANPFLLLVQLTPVHCITIIFIIANGFVSVSTYRSVENDRNLRIKCCFTLGIFFKQGYLSIAITEFYTLLIVNIILSLYILVQI